MARSTAIRVLPFARFQAVLVAHLGLVAGITYSFGGLIYDLVTTGSVNLGTALAFGALLGMPVTFAAFGFVVGIVEALLFNLFARWFGGVEIDFAR
jgi:hypothetical protein